MRQIINFGSVTYKPKHYKLKSMPMNVRYLLSVSPCRKYYNLKAVNPPAADRHIFVPIPFNFRWIPQSDESSTSSRYIISWYISAFVITSVKISRSARLCFPHPSIAAAHRRCTISSCFINMKTRTCQIKPFLQCCTPPDLLSTNLNHKYQFD